MDKNDRQSGPEAQRTPSGRLFSSFFKKVEVERPVTGDVAPIERSSSTDPASDPEIDNNPGVVRSFSANLVRVMKFHTVED
eukprot:jgi/Chrzof1/3870/Cz13g11240.t1